MRVRVHDKDSNTYFISEVYAKINLGVYEKLLVLVPSSNRCYMKLFDCCIKNSDSAFYTAQINVITPETPSNWISLQSGSIDKNLTEYNLLKHNIRFNRYFGFDWIYKSKESLIRLLQGEKIVVSGSIFEGKLIDSCWKEWNYIQSSEDIENLMTETFGFHDSVIKTFNYTSGASVNDNKSMNASASIRRINMVIESQWCDAVELIFEGVTALNLRPPSDNYTADINGVSIVVKEGIIYFYDDIIVNDAFSDEVTWISAYSLCWKFMLRS